MRPLMLALFVVGVAQFAVAEEPSKSSYVMPVATPTDSKSTLSAEQLDHLRAAAKHLIQAGMKTEAEQLRVKIAAIEKNQAEALLAKKEKELALLQSEVERLRKLARREPQISLSFHVLQYSREKLNQSEVPNIATLLPNLSEKVNVPILKNSNEILALLHDLRKRNLVNVLAQPTIITVSGRPASFHSGGEIPTLKASADQTAIGYARFGTEIDAVPIVTGDDKVRLEVRIRVAEIDTAKSVTVGDHTVPTLRARMLDTAAEMRLGETLVLGGMAEKLFETQPSEEGKKTKAASDVETIVLVTPRQVDAVKQAMHSKASGFYVAPAKVIVAPSPLNFGGVIPRIIHQNEEEERLIEHQEQ